MGFILSLIFGFAPMIVFAFILYWLDRYEKEPKILLGGSFLWGVIVAAGGAFIINTLLGVGIYLFTGSDLVTEITTGSLIAPIVEESLKGVAVLIVFLAIRQEFDSILDGIVYAGITALGFAAVENSYYIYNFGYLEDGYEGLFWLVFVRVILVGWQHAFYTAFIGIGLALTRLTRNIWVKIIMPIIGWLLAITIHSIHNTIASLLPGMSGMVLGTVLDWSGWFFMFIIIVWAGWREQKWIRYHLREEVQSGVISESQYKVACSAWAQSMARLKAIKTGQFIATNRFYHLTAELAYKKQQLARIGEESGNTLRIEKTRQKLARLAPQAH
jgi:RsiW-degrading membrane proteinase PrsW (M82 family)